MKLQNFKSKNISGFTLIEIMVAVSIFSIVMLIVIGALLSMNNVNSRAQAMRAVVDNLNFAMEDITRNIRTGGGYECGLSLDDIGQVVGDAHDCKPEDRNIGDTALVFKGQREMRGDNPSDICYFYAFDKTNSTIKYAKISGVPIDARCSKNLDLNDVSDFVSPEVSVAGMRFYVFDSADISDPIQPFIIITLGGDINPSNYNFSVPFNIQTTVSQRSSGSQLFRNF